MAQWQRDGDDGNDSDDGNDGTMATGNKEAITAKRGCALI